MGRAVEMNHLVVTTDDGKITEFELSQRPVITFSDADMIVTTDNEIQIVFSLDDVAEYRIIEDYSGIMDLLPDKKPVTFSMDNGYIRTSATDIDIYSVAGELMISSHDGQGNPVSTSSLSPGIYIVRTGTSTFKIVVK